ncbi:MAG: succinate CoA transferase [Acidobacteriota bacterium]
MSRYPRLTAAEAAHMIRNGETAGFGGFTTTGVPKATAAALAARAREEHAAGRPFQLNVITVSTGPAFDGALAAADAIASRVPWQCDAALRAQINAGRVRFHDMHLSHLTQALRYGSLGKLDWAVVEAAEVTDEGDVLLTSAVGAAPTYCALAPRVLIELNRRHPLALRGMHDLYEPADPPHRREIPVYKASDRIGSPVFRIDPAKIAGVIETDSPDPGTPFDEPGEAGARIGRNVTEFLAAELRAGRIPPEFLPVQSGVGDIANAVLATMGEHPEIPAFDMYTEVAQNAAVALMESGRVRFVSCSAFTMSPHMLARIYANLEWFKQRIVLRPQEITNHPEVIRRLGVISMNTALEVDLSGNVNSTHIFGRGMMNGIGGSGDFTRNAYLSIFTCPSTAKGGKISTIVPLVSHVDHSEHSVQAVATEWGVADLRGLAPRERACAIIDRCAHPDYREALHAYARLAGSCYAPHTLRAAFSFHQRYEDTGDMRPRT